jgi:uncharacterized phiE125 gp8 family phage protein
MATPVSLEDARRQLRLAENDTSMDADIVGYIADAAAWVEKYTGHIIAAREVTQPFHGFGTVELRAWPIAASAVPGVAYVDASGQPVAIPGASLDLTSRPARVSPPNGPFYSFTNCKQPFTVTVRAGYELDDEIPGNMRRAMLILISAYEADREGGDIFQKAEATARTLCRDYRLKRL